MADNYYHNYGERNSRRHRAAASRYSHQQQQQQQQQQQYHYNDSNDNEVLEEEEPLEAEQRVIVSSSLSRFYSYSNNNIDYEHQLYPNISNEPLYELEEVEEEDESINNNTGHTTQSSSRIVQLPKGESNNYINNNNNNSYYSDFGYDNAYTNESNSDCYDQKQQQYDHHIPNKNYTINDQRIKSPRHVADIDVFAKKQQHESTSLHQYHKVDQLLVALPSPPLETGHPPPLVKATTSTTSITKYEKNLSSSSYDAKVAESMLCGKPYNNSGNKNNNNKKQAPSESSSTSTNNNNNNNKPMVEIEPGVYSPLRGADETYRAVKQDFYIPTECFCCCVTIFCIQDAEYILCPECRVISPICCGESSSSSSIGCYGVGLGFTYNDLATFQDDIVRERIREQKIIQKENEQKQNSYSYRPNNNTNNNNYNNNNNNNNYDYY